MRADFILKLRKINSHKKVSYPSLTNFASGPISPATLDYSQSISWRDSEPNIK